MKEITLFQVVDLYRRNFFRFLLISVLLISIIYFFSYQFFKERNFYVYKTTFIIPHSEQLKIVKLNDALTMLYNSEYFNKIIDKADIIYDIDSNKNSEFENNLNLSNLNFNKISNISIINNLFFDQEISNLFKSNINFNNISYAVLPNVKDNNLFKFDLIYESIENFDKEIIDEQFIDIINAYNVSIEKSISDIINEAIKYYEEKKSVTLKNLDSISKLFSKSYINTLKQNINYLKNEKKIAQKFEIEKPIVLDKEIIVNLNRDFSTEIDYTYGYQIIDQQIDYLNDQIKTLSNQKAYYNNKVLSDFINSDFILNNFYTEIIFSNFISSKKYNLFVPAGSSNQSNITSLLVIIFATFLVWAFINFVFIVIYFFYLNYNESLKLNNETAKNK